VGNEAIRDRLHQALRDALRRRRRVAASALRSAMAALDNASGVPPGQEPVAAAGPHLADALTGLGAGEAAPSGLAPGEAGRIVRAETADREAAADGCGRPGHDGQARRLRQEAGTLASALIRCAAH
jgi:uncharacterized protein